MLPGKNYYSFNFKCDSLFYKKDYHRDLRSKRPCLSKLNKQHYQTIS